MPAEVREKLAITIDKGKIAKVGASSGGDQIIELAPDDMVMPGLIDMHVHGGAGSDVMEDTEESLNNISAHLSRYGVTGWLATTYSAPVVDMADVGAAAAWLLGAKDIGAELLGVYHEGPFIAKKMRGIHPEGFLLKPDPSKAEELIAPAAVSIISIAPELEGALKIVDLVKERNIICAIGHTDASYEQTKEAVQRGASHITHCFNSMSGFDYQNPGSLGLALTADEVSCELIADLIHVHPAAISLLIKTKTPARIALISDAISACGQADGVYEIAGQHVRVKKGEARLEDGSLAGSVLTLNIALKNLVQKVGVSLLDAVEMASTTPAKILAVDSVRGKIAEGYEANLTILDKDFNPLYTIVGGNIVYQKSSKKEEVK